MIKAVLTGISDRSGVEIVMTFEKIVYRYKFLEIQQRLRFEHPFDQIVVFMDRMSVHTYNQAK